MKFTNKKSLMIFLVLLVGVAAVSYAVLDPFKKKSDCSNFKINSSEWKNISANTGGNTYSRSPRQKQASKIVKCGSLTGLSKARVRDLLGDPDPTFSTKKSWAYNLASIEDAYLLIYFDTEGRVKRVKSTNG